MTPTGVTPGRLVVHAHFYQPRRVDPFTGQVPREPGAAPFHDWNERINAECYRPNAERGNLERISFDIGPTLANWLAQADPETHARFVAADTAGEADAAHGNAMAQAYHHSILPLASLRDRRTELRWGIREFELRFGRRPTGLWLPETAVDLPSLRLMAEHGITHTILAPWQSADADVETRRPYRVGLGGGRSMVIVYFDGPLSAAVSFDAERDGRRGGVRPRSSSVRGSRSRWATGRPAGADSRRPPRASRRCPRRRRSCCASDGEFYGHHQKFRDLFLERLVGADGSPATARLRGGQPRRRRRRRARGGVPDDACLRADVVELPSRHPALDRRVPVRRGRALEGPAAPGPRPARGRHRPGHRAAAAGAASRRSAFTEARDALRRRDPGRDRARGVPRAPPRRPDVGRADRERLLDLLDAQRWRLAMFAERRLVLGRALRLETQQVLRAAARAVRIVDGYAGTSLERRLREDLCLLTSPSRHIDGYEIYREALADVGQPLP